MNTATYTMYIHTRRYLYTYKRTYTYVYVRICINVYTYIRIYKYVFFKIYTGHIGQLVEGRANSFIHNTRIFESKVNIKGPLGMDWLIIRQLQLETLT